MKRQRSDANQTTLIKVYRSMGCSVEVVSQYLSCDLIVGCMEVNDWVEVKDGEKPPSKRKLSADEQKFQNDWMGRPVVNVKSIEEVIEHVEKMRAESEIIRQSRRWALDNVS